MHFNRSRSRIANVTLVFCRICSLQTPERDPETTRLAHKGGHLNLARSGHLNLASITLLRVTGLMLSSSLGAAWFAWTIRTASRFLRRAPQTAHGRASRKVVGW